METEIATAVAQFGVAGLIGWMWLSERRGAGARDRQIEEAHDRILRDETKLDVLVRALDNNTHALASMEATHRQLAAAFPNPTADQKRPA